jgi:hypothetical protein
MRRDEDLETVVLRGLEDELHVLDGFVLPDAFAHRPPRQAFITQDFILRIDEDHCGVILIYIHCCSFLLILGPTGFGSEQKSASLELRGFECRLAGSVRHFLLLQELFDPTGDLFAVRLKRKMTRVE